MAALWEGLNLLSPLILQWPSECIPQQVGNMADSSREVSGKSINSWQTAELLSEIASGHSWPIIWEKLQSSGWKQVNFAPLPGETIKYQVGTDSCFWEVGELQESVLLEVVDCSSNSVTCWRCMRGGGKVTFFSQSDCIEWWLEGSCSTFCESLHSSGSSTT